MHLLSAFGLDHEQCGIISLVGGGGKTTTMFALAGALKALGRRVLITTTTNIFMPQENQYDDIILSDAPDSTLFTDIMPGTLTCLAGTVMEGKNKLKSVDPAFLDQLHEDAIFDAVIVEADGARRMPIKAPAVYEPVIPSATSLIIGCIGLDALGMPVNSEHVHRPQLFCAATGAELNEEISAVHIVKLIDSPEGLFKGAPPHCKKVVLLNKADTDDSREQARLISIMIAKRSPGVGVSIASMAEGIVYDYRHAGVR